MTRVPLPSLVEFALELAARTTKSASGREYTLAEHAVIVSTFVPSEHALDALLHDARAAGLLSGFGGLTLERQVRAAEARLRTDESAIAFLPTHRAAHVFAVQYLDLIS